MQTHPPNPSTTSLNPPKSLLSLPKELMAEICSQLDKKTAINLLYVHRSFHQPAESRIYRDITLSIPTYWGEPVLIKPDLRYGSPEYIAWAKRQAKEVEMAGRAEARRRAEEMIVLLSRGAERWRYIRKIVIEPRVEANHAIVQILSLARNYVTEVEFIKSRDHMYRTEWKAKRKETFWAKFSDFGSVKQYTFPNLVKVSVHQEDWECSCLPELLLQRTPNLEIVALEGGSPPDYQHIDTGDYNDDECDCPYQEISGVTQHITPPWQATLRVASIICDAKEDHGCPPELAYSITLGNNPKKLTLRLDNVVDRYEACEWLSSLLNHATLEHLEYDIPEIPFSEALELGEIEDHDHSAIQVLIYPIPAVDLAHERLEKLQLSGHGQFTKLKSLGLRTAAKSNSRTTNKPRFAPFDDHIRPAQPITKSQALDLLALDSLDIIHFFPEGAESTFVPVARWESTGTYGIVIRTLKHGHSAELLHTRTFSRSITQKNPNPAITEPTYATSKYPQWEDATYYEGLTVPLSVLCEMKRVHGGSKPWVGRGIEVGKKAWQVLLDWKQENHPDMIIDNAGDEADEVSEVINVQDSEGDDE